MSVICVKKYDDRIEIAADSSDTSSIKRCVSHLAVVGNTIIGSTDPVGLDILGLHMRSDAPASANLFHMTSFVHRFFKDVKEYYSHMDTDGIVLSPYIIACKGRVFSVFGGSVSEITGFDAFGSASEGARTFLHLGRRPEEAVACCFDIYANCYGPVCSKIMYSDGSIV